MEVQRFHDPAKFAAEATPFLMKREAEHCFFLGFLPVLKDQPEAVMLIARDSTGPLAVAIRTPKRPMQMTNAPAAAAIALAEYCAEPRIDLTGVMGVQSAVEAFATRWTQLTGMSSHPGVRMAIHALTSVIPPPRAAGAMRIATMNDFELIVQWADAFRTEVNDQGAEQTRSLVADRLPKGQFAIWENGGPVALAGFTGPTPNGIRVICVYTPAEHRKRSYASNLVAALSQHLLDSGRQFCFLYTDLANPTANKIYREIGYRSICEQVRLDFA